MGSSPMTAISGLLDFGDMLISFGGWTPLPGMAGAFAYTDGVGMKKTAAAQLLDLFSTWGAPSRSVYAVRSGSTEGSFAAVTDDSLRACALLDEISRELQSRNLYDANRSLLVGIAKKVFIPEANWSVSNSNSPLTADQVGALSTWDAILKAPSESEFRLDDADVEAVHEALEEALDILRTVPGVPEEHRQYLADLLRGCGQLLDGDDPDLIGARSRFHEAVGAAIMQPGVRSSEEGGKLIEKLSRIGGIWFFASVGVPVVTGVAANVGGAFLLEALAR